MPKKMKQRQQPYKKSLLLKEFPFLSQLFSVETFDAVDSINIQRGDARLMDRTGETDRYSSCGGGHYHYTLYFAVSESGEVTKLEAGGHDAGPSGWQDWSAPTVGEQLFANNLTPTYIVSCVRQDTDDFGNGDATENWTIFKMNKFDLLTHHQHMIDKAAEQIKAELAAACQRPE